ncbi:MAG TPA: class I SAM-dependent methyltransferase [Flavobacterium sp.]|jgi:2-polyprenyl-3-methyl-5-hydroxy-6-metoxy-1,4-benzoquinol methylase
MNTTKPHYLTVTDHSVSKEIFELCYDAELDLLATHPQPSAEALPDYYESDDYISHTDGKRTFFEYIYQTVKNIALRKKVKLINRLSNNKGHLLDIGAGTGDFLVVASANGWSVTGTEPSSKARAIAEAKGVRFIEDAALLADHSFDIITMWHVLEHVPDFNRQFAELKRLIKPDGRIVVAVPNFKSYDATHYGKFWAAYDVPRHLWHFSKGAIGKISLQHQLELEEVLPMKFDSFYVSLLSEKYRHGKMRYMAAMTTGIKSNRYGSKYSEFSSHIYVIRPRDLK